MIRLTRAQVRRIDELALRDYGIPGIVLMENAARSAAAVGLEMLTNTARRVLIICGGGNNGGDGLGVARHLHNVGCAVTIVKAFNESKLPPDAATNLRIVSAMKLPIFDAVDYWSEADLLVDALFGTGLTQPPRELLAQVIERINQLHTPTLSIDVPSGLDCDTGLPLGPACVRAAQTVTFVAEKVGFAKADSKPYTGKINVGDIGCPRELLDRVASNL